MCSSLCILKLLLLEHYLEIFFLNYSCIAEANHVHLPIFDRHYVSRSNQTLDDSNFFSKIIFYLFILSLCVPEAWVCHRVRAEIRGQPVSVGLSFCPVSPEDQNHVTWLRGRPHTHWATSMAFGDINFLDTVDSVCSSQNCLVWWEPSDFR